MSPMLPSRVERRCLPTSPAHPLSSRHVCILSLLALMILRTRLSHSDKEQLTTNLPFSPRPGNDMTTPRRLHALCKPSSLPSLGEDQRQSGLGPSAL
ncbi:hypothetical protein BC629DRAFT_240744 [Irpex lacteus]|nr:hypothetical protein BC629DRAFT_240744 [Irpex lacteus]